MADRIKIGISGLGRTGWSNHALNIEKIPEKFQIAAVTDPNTDRMKEAKDRYDCKTYATFAEMLKDASLEIVVVATPSHMHADQAIQAMAAGKKVVCEKPMAADIADADKIVAAARKTGVLLTVFQNNHYAPDFQKIKEVIDSGKLGRIVLIKMAWNGFGRRWDWQTLQKFGGGSLNNTGPHPVENALVFFGPAEPEIFSHLEKVLTLGDAEDHVKIIMRAKGAPMIDLEISSCCAMPEDKWMVLGSQGGLSGSGSQLKWKYIKPEELPKREVDIRPTPDRSYNSEPYNWTEESWDWPKDVLPTPVCFYNDLYKTIREGAPLVITPEHARRVMWFIDKCHRLCPV